MPMPPDTTPRWRLILNGKAAADQSLRAAVATAREDGLRLDVRVTWEAGDTSRLVDEAIADEVDALVAAGGDGTLSAVATALAKRDAPGAELPALGLVPLGTANDFAAAAGIPNDVLGAFAIIRDQPAVAIDLLKLQAGAEDHWAANLISGGFGTQVTAETGEGMKKLLGGLAYVIAGIGKLGRIEPIQARIHGQDLDGGEFAWDGGFIALGIGNGRQAGGGQALCPDALIDDGLLDVTVVPELTGEVGATVATLLTEGKHAALERVATRVRLPWIEIDAAATLTLNLDGEPVEARHFRIDCVPRRVRMHLPGESPLLNGWPEQLL